VATALVPHQPPATDTGLSVRYGPEGLSLAAQLGLVPLSLGGVLGHHRLVEPLLDIAAKVSFPTTVRAGRGARTEVRRRTSRPRR
jgi:hypothetical protein